MRLLTIQRIPIRLHGSFVLLAMVMLGFELLRGGVIAALGALLLWGAIFGTVVLHELGHALAGRLFGIRTRDITLYPFGGVARMELEQLAPLPEVVVAVAGPLVNFTLAAVAWMAHLGGLPGMEKWMVLNLVLGSFNLLPAFPMDGGRVLRAVLSLFMDPVMATLIALRVSRWFGWGFLVAAPIVGAWSLALVGGLLLLVNRAATRRWQVIAAMGGRTPPPRTAARTTTRTIPRRPDERLDLPFAHPRA
ncbi:MAG: Zn-dependent protease [Deltaproteobacteria bacterium]|nr:MAG: Zn-dependent protease [Deltaproteobacteria bacterium]